MSESQNSSKRVLLTGAKKGWHYFIWTCKIIIPISLLVVLLQWTGWLNTLDVLLNPLMSLLNLPPQAALPIISGMLINLYPVAAIITVIPFTAAQMTLIAVFTLIAHNLIMEGVVQHRSGFNGFLGALCRIAVATVTVVIVSRFMGDTSQSVTIPASMTAATPLLEVLKDWVISTFFLLLRVFGIIMVIMVLQEYIRSRGWLENIQRSFRHLMSVMGLSRQTALIWLTANIFGLFYGGAVIVEEVGRGTLSRDEVKNLQLSIGVNHSMIEDPGIFAVLGLPAFWLWVPRFVMAIAAVQFYRLLKLVKNKVFPQPA
jgi:hypothetical protein